VKYQVGKYIWPAVALTFENQLNGLAVLVKEAFNLDLFSPCLF